MTKHVFFLGVGGIGMSALARHLHSLGHVVGGYDANPSPLLDALQEEGLWVTHLDDPEILPSWVLGAAPNTLTVVYTPAIPPNLAHLLHFKAQGHVPMKRAHRSCAASFRRRRTERFVLFLLTHLLRKPRSPLWSFVKVTIPPDCAPLIIVTAK